MDVWDELHIATNPDEKTGRRGSQLSISPLKLLGESLKVPVHLIPHTKPEFKKWALPELFTVKGDEIPGERKVVITASFGRILSSAMLDNFLPTNRLNVHPSLLPAYRGPAPIQHAILNNEKETGVSVIEMLKYKQGIDAGNILRTARIPIHEGAMFPELRDTLAYIGGRLLVSVLRDMRVGLAKFQPQPELGSAPHAPLITAHDSAVNFATMTAEEIVRRHRAISHQRPLITCLPNEKTVQLHYPYVLKHIPEQLSGEPGSAIFQTSLRTVIIRCADGSVLAVPMMRQQDKALMESQDWWNGVKGLGFTKEHGQLRIAYQNNYDVECAASFSVLKEEVLLILLLIIQLDGNLVIGSRDRDVTLTGVSIESCLVFAIQATSSMASPPSISTPPMNLPDADIEFLPGCSILPPEIQRLVHNSDHTSLNERQTKYNQNMKTVYGSIAALVRDEKNPWGQYTHLETGKHILMHADDQSQSYVYIFSNDQDAVPSPGNRLSATIGHYSGQGGWFDSYSYIIRGAVDLTAGMATMWALGRWMSRSLLNQAEVFTVNALNTLAEQLVVRNVMTAANGRVFARVATNVFRKTFKYGVKALKVGIALLVAWGVDELISYIFKTYFVTIKIFNYDARLVEWIPDSYYGYNETVANGKWSVETIPKVLNIGEKRWMPGLGWVGPDDYVGHYISYTWSNDSYGAGVAIAMTVKRPGTSESINFMYRVPKAEDNSMGLDWGSQGNQEYLNSGRDKKVKQLSINSPIKVSGTSPALGGEANNSYSFTITIGTLPPPKG
ncbi:hypothetical protein H0H93_014701 [Arthromyces matolae]|nr:hypothetical protein H0H93_014701 [Arthromyces matolae]